MSTITYNAELKFKDIAGQDYWMELLEVSRLAYNECANIITARKVHLAGRAQRRVLRIAREVPDDTVAGHNQGIQGLHIGVPFNQQQRSCRAQGAHEEEPFNAS